MIDPQWLAALLFTGVWTTFFSLFNTRWIRGYRNFGLLAGYAVGLAMPFFVGWQAALATWAVIGAASGLLYFAYEALSYARSRDAEARPKVKTIFDGLYLWPIMLPEAVEYLLAEVGILKPPAVAEPEPVADAGADPAP